MGIDASGYNALERKRPYLQGVKVLVDGGIDVVPDIYIKPEHQRLCNSGAFLESRDVPVIDLGGLQDDRRLKTIKAIGQASEKWGFFQVTNHGVSSSLIESMKEAAYQFFDTPIEEKMKYHSTSMSSRTTMYGTSFNPYEEKTFDWRDYLRHACNPLAEDDIASWPQQPPQYREIAAKYSEALAALSRDLLNALSESLGLCTDYLNKAFGAPNEQFLLLNYYPPCPEPDLALGLSCHSDVGGITILLQDSTSGLQVLNGSQWIPVKPIPGAFVVNVGDQLQVLSNGKYKSVEHRVVLNSEAPRLSIALFYNPCFDTLVSPVEELLDESNPPLYKEFPFSDYKKCFYSKLLDGKSCLANFQRQPQEQQQQQQQQGQQQQQQQQFLQQHSNL